jgi:hypothetical protein
LHEPLFKQQAEACLASMVPPDPSLAARIQAMLVADEAA